MLLKSDFSVKVSDFGLSQKLCDERNHEWNNAAAIPILYTAPESLATRNFTISSDSWSFGVIIWELFTFAKQPPYLPELENKLNINLLAIYLESGNRLTIPNIVPDRL